jgi:chemotaxis protein methyltransferase WspC
MNIARVEGVLRDWIGLDAQTIGTAAVARAARTRMDAVRIDDADAYASLIANDPAERDRLVEEVIVAESWFFRDPQVFAFVADVAVTLASVPGRSPLRILCAPCASGEEPYSVAMALLDAGLTSEQFVIDAIDVSRAALDRARLGRYSSNAFRNADSSFRDRWFHSDGSRATISDGVRSCVRFTWANLLDESFVAGRDRYDIVFCRNLLIYLTGDARRRVERALDRLLRPDGVLVVGAAEPSILKGDWIPAGAASLFALRRGVHAPARPRAPVPSAPPVTVAWPRPVADTPPTLAAVLEEAGRLANARRHLDALEVCERGRSRIAPSPELFFLMGILHQSLGDLDRAEACFHKTLYLDATHEEALLALALLAQRRGDVRMAETYRQSAARALARKETP